MIERKKREMKKLKGTKFKILYNNNYHVPSFISLNFYYFQIIYFHPFFSFFPLNLITTLSIFILSSLVYLYLFDLRSSCIVTQRVRCTYTCANSNSTNNMEGRVIFHYATWYEHTLKLLLMNVLPLVRFFFFFPLQQHEFN